MSDVRARPMPRPARTCGSTVHATDADGRNASATTPAPTRAQPAVARTRGSPRIRIPTSAAAGTIATTNAASSGDSDHPDTSKSTSRNSTALSAAETSASAIAAPSWMRSTRRPVAPVPRRRAAASIVTPAEPVTAQRRRREDADRSLDEEDRAPVEQLGEDPAQGGPNGGPEHRGRCPQSLPAALFDGEEREPGHETGGRAERLRSAQHEERCQRVDQAAPRSGRGKDDETPDAETRGAHESSQPLGRDQRDGEHERVDGEHGGNPLDGRVELDDQLRERERHDRRVGERQAHPNGHKRSSEPHVSENLACVATQSTNPVRDEGSQLGACDAHRWCRRATVRSCVARRQSHRSSPPSWHWRSQPRLRRRIPDGTGFSPERARSPRLLAGPDVRPRGLEPVLRRDLSEACGARRPACIKPPGSRT